MNVACPQCASVFRVDPAKVPAGGVRARCSICGGVIPVPEPRTAVATPAAGVPAIVTPAAEAQLAEVQPAEVQPAEVQPAEVQPSETQPTGLQPRDVPPVDVPPVDIPPVDMPPVDMPPTATAPAAAPIAAPPPDWSAVADVEESRPAPAEPSPDLGSSVTVSGTHFNPYLARDPQQRAKRLARALASDIVTYYPDKHAEAIRDGTFRELFSEEIKKSYEDYVSQVGAELAESTTYFQDALNEVLARGKRVF